MLSFRKNTMDVIRSSSRTFDSAVPTALRVLQLLRITVGVLLSPLRFVLKIISEFFLAYCTEYRPFSCINDK